MKPMCRFHLRVPGTTGRDPLKKTAPHSPRRLFPILKTKSGAWRQALSGIAAGLLWLGLSQAQAGKPLPYEYPALLRQATIAKLRFQEALSDHRWQEALSLCSAQVQSQSKQWPSPEAFFRETMPVDAILTQTGFGYWREEHGPAYHAYGLFVPLTDPEFTPAIHWNWSLFTTNSHWVIDFDPQPIDLEDRIAKKRAETQAHEKRVAAILQNVEPKLRGIKTHLTLLSPRFVPDAPLLFRVELINHGTSPVHYRNVSINGEDFTVYQENHDPLPYEPVPCQKAAQSAKLAPGEAIVLADQVDLRLHFAGVKPGRYYVQFDGWDLLIGEPMTVPKSEENEEYEKFVAAPMRFPSNRLEIQVPSTNGASAARR